MSTDVEDELRAALRSYRAALPAPPDLTRSAVRGGSRRQLRRRAALLAVPVAAAAVAVAGTTVVPRWTYSPPDGVAAAASLSTPDRSLLAGPTRGDLADDGAYLAEVRSAWGRSHRRSANADRGIFDHLLGTPVVVWAGSTPVGRAAVVVQLADLREHDNVQLTREGVALLWGFVGPGTDGRPRVVADAYPVPGGPDVEAAWIDPGRTTLLVADRGNTREEVSWGLTYTPDGRAAPVWTPVRFTAGVAVLTAPAGTRPTAARIRYAGGSADVGNAGEETTPQDFDQRLPWRDGERLVWPAGPDPAAAWPAGLPDFYGAEEVLDTALVGRLPERFPDVRRIGRSLWYVVGRTPDGSRFVAGERALDLDPTRVYAVLSRPGRPARVVSGPIHLDRPAPVVLELPDRQGLLVAAYAKTLTWTEDGVERSARDAALVPPGATDLRADGTEVPTS